MSLTTHDYIQHRKSAFDTNLIEFIMVCSGMLLPLISLSRQDFIDVVLPLWARIALVDVLVAFLIGLLFLTRKLHLYSSVKAYIYVLVLATAVGVWSAQYYGDPGGLAAVITELAALMMALMYWILGYNAGLSQRHLRLLIVGLMLGGGWQGVIVVHDAIFPAQQWFQSSYLGVVSGTFRNGAQLSLFGYALVGIMFTFGWAVFSRRVLRRLTTFVGLLGIFFVIVGSRRMIIAALFVWLGVFVFTGVFASNRKRIYGRVGVVIAVLLVLFFIFGDTITESFLGQRVEAAIDVLQEQDNFFMIQTTTVVENIRSWFPFGLGVGRGRTLSNAEIYAIDYEIHNAHLALLAELGVVGLLSFYWLTAGALFQKWRNVFGLNTKTVKAIAIAFVISGGFAMLHATLHRDRGFMLYTGLITSCIVNQTEKQAQHEDSSDLTIQSSA